MDDFSIATLHESRNEWCSRLVTILTPLIIDGYKSIMDESVKLCRDNKEMDKYLMTFQNFISRIPKWNPAIIETERKRICEKSGCSYLEDLVTCVHIIQLKVLTAMRVGQKQKKIDINIPKLDDFIHKAYINVARKVYKNVYLFELGIPPLQTQKNSRELEIIVQECILNTIRESIPVEAILKAYMDETVEEDVKEEIKEQFIEEVVPVKQNVDVSDPKHLSFNNIDYVKDSNNNVRPVSAPKSVEDIEKRNAERVTLDSNSNDDDDDNNANIKIRIFDDDNDTNSQVKLDQFDIHNIQEPEIKLPELLADNLEIEILE
jgi:hypothetical protein